ncbi:MAG: hypothetical protein HPY75_01945 [Actinobacteria bacterium]|nr:hypothetical protein [Actinomycetota bacterium]
MEKMAWEGEKRGMILDREHKVAVATLDGKRIADHFGSAPMFAVYTVRKGKVLDWEVRANREGCSRDEEDTQAGCWELVERLLPDVRVVICGGMGENAYVGLLRRDVLPVTTPEVEVERAVEEYLRGRLEDDHGRVHPPRRGGPFEEKAG